jgi:hypothetical protein
MRRTLALVLVVGLLVSIAEALEDNPSLTDTPPDKDTRLVKLTNARPQKIGVLTYYQNKGGGYTFREGETIVFCALPYAPIPHPKESLFIVGTSKMPLGCQTIYQSLMTGPGFGTLHRTDIPIAQWTRDTPDGKFRLSILTEDNETRLKLKSIIPVLEHAGHAR